MSFKTWLRHKFTGPYYYGGLSEHVLTATMDALDFICSNEKLRVPPSFMEWEKNNKAKDRMVKIEDATTDDLKQIFMAAVDELIERLPLSDILFPEGEKLDETQLDKLLMEKEDMINEILPIYAEVMDKINKIDADPKMSDCKKESLIQPLFEEKFYPLLEECNMHSIPLTSSIIYEYDYGDGWEVKITCQGIYKGSENEDTETVISTYRPLCIAIDGLPVCDDVGGPHGYTEMLNSLHGTPSDTYEYNDAESTRDWARMMGWTGRMPKPDKLF